MTKQIYVFLVLICLFSCTSKKKEEKVACDFDAIQKKGTLTIITLSGSTSYFIYKDEPMGYDYDLCKNFCDHYGLKLEVKVAENSTRLIQMLRNGDGDLVAYNCLIQHRLKDSLIYCGLKQISRQVLVQRDLPKDSLVKNVTQLVGKEVYIKENTRYDLRLKNLNAELGGGIVVKDIEKDTVTSEDLIQMVSDGKINYTVSDENLARLNKTYYQNINVSLLISFEQPSAWIVRRVSPKLAKALDNWFAKNGNTPVYKSITKKYFELRKLPSRDNAIEIPKGHISPFDDLFQKYAKTLGYDWRLLAAISYQESKFHTGLSSWAGATGLMGLMPRTAQSLGIRNKDRTDPELSIKAGTALLARLNKIFEKKITNSGERIKFVLAAYNGGNGHIFDAQALARKYGFDPTIWDANVRKYVALKSSPEYYNDSVCKNGYFRGSETIAYVDEVLARWQKYKQKTQNNEYGIK